MAEHPYGYVQDGKVYRKAFGEHPALEIGEVKDTPEAAFSYYEQRYQQLLEKINQLEQDIYEKSNKGSYLMKLLHMKETLPEYEGLGDFEALHERLEKLENYIREIIQQNRERNLEIKTALLAEAEPLREMTDWKEGAELAKDLKMRWLRTGSLDPEHQDKFEEEFNELLQGFFDRRSAFFADRKLMLDERQKQYEMLIIEAQRAVMQPNSRQALYDVRNIQQRWRDIGKIPAEIYKPLLYEIQRITRPVMQQGRPQRYSGGGDRSGGSRPMGGRERTQGGYSSDRSQGGGGYQGGGSSYQRPQGQGRPYDRPQGGERRSYGDRSQRQYSNAGTGEERLEERRALLERMRAIDPHDRNAVTAVEAVQNEYKALGFARTPEVARISEQLFDTGNLLREKHFLNKLAYAKVPGIEQQEKQEQARQKIRLLRDLLSRDERELQTYQENMALTSPGSSDVAKMMETKLRSQQRKVKIKKMLLEELQQQANS
ncbi:hypothetical protein D770_18815 [Flammeovirgaceae bacterium 311]|nr:hypothetical protein D770_18815 [Flammeovirgaceae bacterium 311]